MRLFVYDMLVNVNVIYYVHVCEQARWARSAGNSAIEKLTEVTKQNKDMKSQIDDLRKYISVIKTGLAKQQTPAAVERQEPSAPEVPVNNNNTSVNVETSNIFSVLTGEEDDQLTLENCSSSSLDVATTYNTDPSHDSTIDSHDSTPPVRQLSASRISAVFSPRIPPLHLPPPPPHPLHECASWVF